MGAKAKRIAWWERRGSGGLREQEASRRSNVLLPAAICASMRRGQRERNGKETGNPIVPDSRRSERAARAAVAARRAAMHALARAAVVVVGREARGHARGQLSSLAAPLRARARRAKRGACNLVRFKEFFGLRGIDSEMYAILAYLRKRSSASDAQARRCLVLCDCKPALRSRLRMRTARGCQKA